MAIVFLGIGSNLGDRQANVDRAISLLKENADITVLEVSSLIESTPEGKAEQGNYLNGVLKIETDLLPLELLSQLKMVERRLGRVRPETGAPRTMDLDILFYDDVVIMEGKSLSIPHSKLADRLFVLEPLSQIAPDFVHPKLQKSVRELFETLQKDASSAQNL